jgi:hypothetical protein
MHSGWVEPEAPESRLGWLTEKVLGRYQLGEDADARWLE